MEVVPPFKVESDFLERGWATLKSSAKFYYGRKQHDLLIKALEKGKASFAGIWVTTLNLSEAFSY